MKTRTALPLVLGLTLLVPLAGCTSAATTATPSTSATSTSSAKATPTPSPTSTPNATSAPTPAPTPAPSATPKPSAGVPQPAATKPVVDECVDGNAVVTVSAKKIARLPEGCDVVSIVGTGGSVTLGPVQHLVFEAEGVDVTVTSVKRVDFAGDDNTLHFDGAKPTVNRYKTSGNVVAEVK